MLKHLIRTAALYALVSLCALSINAQDKESQDAQAQIDEAIANAAYDRGARYFTFTYADYPSPLFWAEVAGVSSVLVYDTGVSSIALIQEFFDTVPLEEQPDFALDVPIRAVEPISFKFHPESEPVERKDVVDIAWKAFGTPDFLDPFFSGLMVPFYYDENPAAFERHPEEGWFALFASPHEPDFLSPVKIEVDTERELISIAMVDVRLPGTDNFQTLRLWLDTGNNFELELNSSLFPAGSLDDDRFVIGHTAAGEIEGTKIGNVDVLIGDQTVQVNNVDVVDERPVIVHDIQIDGVLGSAFLNRFHHVIDAAAGVLILEMDGADLSPSRKFLSGTPRTLPHQSWTGAVVIDPADWADQHDIREADMIYSVNGVNIDALGYSTMVDEATDPDASNNVCVFRHATEAEKSEAFCFDTIPVTPG